MSDLRKAAEMALDALETLWDILDDIDTASDMAKENDAWYRKRVEALQKKRWDTMITTDGYKLKDGPVETLRQALAQPEQEPVAWVYNGILHEFDPSEFATSEVKPLYTAPPKRKPLTDEEIILIVAECAASHQHTDIHFARAIEAKLKEKNGG